MTDENNDLAVLRIDCETVTNFASVWRRPSDRQALAMLTVAIGLLHQCYGTDAARKAVMDMVTPMLDGLPAETRQ